MTETPDNSQLPEDLQDWLITEQIFKDSGIDTTQETSEHNDFLRNLNAIGSFLASISSPTVQFAQVSNGQIIIAFDETEPVDLTSPFFPVDEEGQLWALHSQDIETLTPGSNTPQISSLTAYGYNHADKLMLFNLQEQRILSISATATFAQAMVRALAVEHAIEPWNASRIIYLVGFGIFGDALKYNLASYHSGIELVDTLVELDRDHQTLDNCTIFSIGQDAGIVSEFIRSTTNFSLGMVADVPIGGGFIYYQETDDRGALEPGNITIFPFLMAEGSEDYQAVEANYHKYLSGDEISVPQPAADEETDKLDANGEPANFTLTDDDLRKLLTDTTEEDLAIVEEVGAEESTPASEADDPTPTTEKPTPAPVPAPTAYLKLMGPTPEIISENGVVGGFPAEIIAYTYLQQHYGQTPPTFSDLCTRLWGEPPTGSNKSKFSARRKRAKEKLHETIPTAELITERDGWKVLNLPVDIDHTPPLPSAEPLTETPWATPYIPDLKTTIEKS